MGNRAGTAVWSVNRLTPRNLADNISRFDPSSIPAFPASTFRPQFLPRGALKNGAGLGGKISFFSSSKPVCPMISYFQVLWIFLATHVRHGQVRQRGQLSYVHGNAQCGHFLTFLQCQPYFLQRSFLFISRQVLVFGKNEKLWHITLREQHNRILVHVCLPYNHNGTFQSVSKQDANFSFVCSIHTLR